MRLAGLLLIALSGSAALLLLPRKARAAIAPGTDTVPAPQPQPEAGKGTVADTVLNAIGDLLPAGSASWLPESITDLLPTSWSPAKIPSAYRDTIAAAETANGIPRHMLARLLWQESRYNPDARNAASGAVGIAQFMPATAREIGVDPLNPTQAIWGAARYLADLYRRFGSWTQALAAYNWGLGNLTRKGLEAAPTETRNYVRAILADVGALENA